MTMEHLREENTLIEEEEEEEGCLEMVRGIKFKSL